MRLKDKISIGWSILKANLFGTRTPVAVYLAVTDYCNLACRYCNIPDKKKSKDMTTEQIFSLIDQITAAGCKRLQLTGGEPMLRKDTGIIIDYAHSKGIFTTMSSNGFQVKERIKEIKSLDTLFLSIDGFKVSHDNHKGYGTWDRVIEAAEIAQKNGITVWATCVISKKNYKDIGKFLELMKKKGIMINFHILYYTSEKLEKHFHLFEMPKDMIMSSEEIRQVLREIVSHKHLGLPVASSDGYLNHLIGWKDYNSIYSLEKTPGIKCWAGKLHCYVDADGKVYACGDCCGRTEAENFLTWGFDLAFKATKNPCESCIVACDVEQNLMFSLDLKTIWNWFRKVK
jgi:MoaA/NifB/PqqE/SkfB family radical SAM enzyme